MTTLLRTDSGHNDFLELVKLLDADLALRDGDDHAFFAQYNKVDAINNVVVAYHNGLTVGCGAVKKYEDEVGEVKRMFVQPAFRGKGIAGQVLSELENWAAELGFTRLVLETGKAQPEAIRLYTKSGYKLIPNYGQYEGVESSVCMEKTLLTDYIYKAD